MSVTYSVYFSARNALWQEPQASPRALTFTPISASSLALAAAANSPAAFARFLEALAKSSDFSQIASVAFVFPVVLPLGKRLGIFSAVPMISLALVSITA